jgi:hypothetical protein
MNIFTEDSYSEMICSPDIVIYPGKGSLGKTLYPGYLANLSKIKKMRATTGNTLGIPWVNGLRIV